jgi:EAL domain-containing protein (putative c-di-GMP-specific phosphodiesterase class I)
MFSSETISAPATWRLVGKIGDAGPLQRIPLTPLPFQVGRIPGVPLCLPVPQISKIHAEIYERSGFLFVRDLGSTNGTYVNGKRADREYRLSDGDMIQFASQVFRVQFEQQVTMPATVGTAHCDRALLLLQLDRLLVDREVVPHFQPILSLRDDHLFGYEILGRSRLFGLQTPKAIFDIAGMFDLEQEVSELFRSVGVRLGMNLPGTPNLFLNTHPTELGTPELLESMRALRDLHPNVPITLEIHEAAVTSPAAIGELRTRLHELNVGLAYDDFGAGQSRLLELIEVPPDFIKFDMAFIKGIDTAPACRQTLLESLVRVVRSLGIAALAEGIESPGEAVVCRQLGFDFAQGFHFGRPQQACHFAEPSSRAAGSSKEEAS